MGDLRRLSNGFQNEVRSALDTVDDPTRTAGRRNGLAEEEPANGSVEAHPPRTEPLVAGPDLPPRNGAEDKPTVAMKPVAKKPSDTKPATAKKATPKKAATKKASPKNGTAVKKATPTASPAKAAKKSKTSTAPRSTKS
jgi:hypothetical protein